jgi:hypothetical protein
MDTPTRSDKPTPSRIPADQPLATVLLAWALCGLLFAVYLYHYSISLPWADEWELTPVATGQTPLSLSWLFLPQNEHRTPLTRLEVVLLGWLDAWKLQALRGVNLALLAGASLSLILAARAVRGCSAWSDAFLCLLILTPWQYESILYYGYSYALALALMCLALSAVMTGWPLHSLKRWWSFVTLALMVTFAGGPAGNVWAIGLCALGLRCWREQLSRPWRVQCIGGVGLIVAVSAAMLGTTPAGMADAQYHSDSWRTTLKASAKVLVSWLGEPVMVLRSGALVVLLVPVLYLAWRIITGPKRPRGNAATHSLAGASGLCPGAAGNCVRQRPDRWLDLAVILLATLAVGGAIGHSRGQYGALWLVPHYCTLVIPVTVVVYLLLVRLRAPAVIPGLLAVVAAGCVGWNWSVVIPYAQARYQTAEAVWEKLRRGQEPLSVVAKNHYRDVGFRTAEDLLYFFLHLRDTKLSAFAPGRREEPIADMGFPQVWPADTGRLNGNIHAVADNVLWINSAPMAKTVLESTATAAPGSASYDITVPADGSYQLCCRLCAPAGANVLSLAVDQGPAIERVIPAEAGYFPYSFEPWLPLTAGRHTLTISLPKPGTRLDLLELIPRSRSCPQMSQTAQIKN